MFEDLSDDIRAVLEEPNCKAFRDFRDRASYLHLTGRHPSHLRKAFNRMLVAVAVPDTGSRSQRGRTGPYKVDDGVARRLDLESHPMVQKVETSLRDGYRIAAPHGANGRRPFGRVFLERGEMKLTVQIDGSIHEFWKI